MEKSETARKAGLNFTIGVGFVITALVAQLGVGAIMGQRLSGTINDIGTGFGSGDLALLGTAILSMLVTGFLVFIWTKLRKHIAIIFHLQVKTPEVHTKHRIAFVITLIVMGIITSLVFYGFSEFIRGISPDNDLSSIGALLDAVVTMNPMLIVGVFFTLMVFGTLVTWLGTIIAPVEARIEKRLPDQLKA